MPRRYRLTLRRLLRHFPAVTVLGPRQCGKTTFIRQALPAWTRRVPFEVKLHSSPTAEDAQGLRRCMRDLDLPHGYIIYPGRERYSLGQGVIALPAEPLLARPESVRGL